jgi:hypothetical protein
MTASLLLEPQEYSPVNGNVWYRYGINTDINPASFSAVNLNYVVNVNQLSFTGSVIQSFPTVVLPPDPSNDAAFDAQRMLKTQVNYDLTHTQQTLEPQVNDTDTWISFNTNYGFSYDPGTTFSNAYDTNGFLSFTFSTDITNILEVNDTISYQLQVTSFTIASSGTASITQISSSYSIVTDIQDISLFYTGNVGTPGELGVFSNSTNGLQTAVIFIGGIPPSVANQIKPGMLWAFGGQTSSIVLSGAGPYPYGGTYGNYQLLMQLGNPQSGTTIGNSYQNVTYSFYNTVSNGNVIQPGNITSLYRINGTSSTRYGYDGTRQYDQNYNVFNFSVYAAKIGTSMSSAGMFLTDYTQTKQVFISNFETLAFIANANEVNFPLTTYVITYDQNNNIINQYNRTDIGASQSGIIYTIGAGPQNIINHGELDLTGVDHYTVQVWDTDHNTIIQPFTYQIVPNCSVYPNVRVMFMNRFGQFDYWNFNKDDLKTINTTRTIYRKQLPYNYNIGDRGDTTLSQKVNEEHTIQTDWISEYDYNYLIELATSPEIYIMSDFNTNPFPALITDTTFATKTVNRDRIFNLSIGYQFAYDINTQTS